MAEGSDRRWVNVLDWSRDKCCAIARRQNDRGFLITAYPTDAIKAGEQLWTKSK